MRIEVEQTHVGRNVHEYGAVITPKHASILRFEVDGGEVVWAKKVTIPARPYMRPAATQGAAATLTAFSGALRTAIKALT